MMTNPEKVALPPQIPLTDKFFPRQNFLDVLGWSTHFREWKAFRRSLVYHSNPPRLERAPSRVLVSGGYLNVVGSPPYLEFFRWTPHKHLDDQFGQSAIKYEIISPLPPAGPRDSLPSLLVTLAGSLYVITVMVTSRD